ncbi:MAG: hypothetical protein ACRCT1_18460 [Microcoleaceae cyanobacterium]
MPKKWTRSPPNPLSEKEMGNSIPSSPLNKQCCFILTEKTIFGDRLRIRYNNFTAPYTFAQLN